MGHLFTPVFEEACCITLPNMPDLNMTSSHDSAAQEKYLPFRFLDIPPLGMLALVGVFVSFAMRLEPPRAQGNRVESWTGLRCFVACGVYLHHSHYVNVNLAGWFLMMSGAMLSLGKGGGGEGCPGWVKFLIRRLARVIPAYWVALCFRLDHVGVYTFTNFFPLEDLVWQPREDNQLWFVATVIHLYCMFPLVMACLDMVGTKQSTGRALVVAVLAYCFQLATSFYLLATSGWYDGTKTETLVFGVYVEFYKNPIVRLPLFVQGICCAQISQQLSSAGESSLHRLGILTDASFVVFFVYLITSQIISEKGYCDNILAGIFCDGSIFAAQTMFSPLLCMPLVGLGSGAKCKAQYLLTRPVVLLLGKWSYGVYLYNQCSCPGALRPGLLLLAASYAKCCALGGVSFTLIEEPSQRFANWLTTSPAVEGSDGESTTSTSSEDETEPRKHPGDASESSGHVNGSHGVGWKATSDLFPQGA